MNIPPGIPAVLAANETAPRPGGGGGGMKTALSGALPALVCAGVLALASGETQAQTPSDPRNQCGALSSGAATCTNRAYSGGIRYDAADGWNNGVAGPVTLTVTGGSATTVTAPASPPNAWTDSAITVRTLAQDPLNPDVSRAIVLTVGSGANAVAIREGASATSDGVYIHQDGRGDDGTTVTLGRGVTIGATSAPMGEYGVQLLVIQGTNSGVHKIESAARIHSAQWGLLMDARGSGDTMVTNSGSITISETGGNASWKSGIRVLDWSGNNGSSRTGNTRTTVTNSGAITVSAAGAHGIHVDANGRGRYKIVHSGTGANRIMASGANGHGIYVNARNHRHTVATGAAAAVAGKAVEIASTGDITASGINGRGIYVYGNGTRDAIDVTAGAGAIRAGSDTGAGDAGIWVVNDDTGAIAVANSANIAASTFGVFANNYGTSNETGAVTVTHSANAIAASRGIGIAAVIGNNAPSANSSDVTVDVTGGSVTASPTRNSVAIAARSWGTGSVNVDIGEGATLTARNNVGVFAVIENNPRNRTGGITIDQAGTISGQGGVYALVTPHASGASRADNDQPVVDITWTGNFEQVDRGAVVVQANSLSHALAIDHETAAAEIFRGEGAGILAEVMSWRTASYFVSGADKPDIADAAAADAILDSTSGDMASLKSNILQEIREALTSTTYTIAGVDTRTIAGNDGMITDPELVAWLKTRDDRATVMTQALQYAFTRQEKNVLTALENGGDVASALEALQDARGGNLPAGYRDRVMAIAGYRNDGNIRIAVNAPSSMNGMTGTSRIVSGNDGVRAMFAFADDNNGSIDVTVGEGASVTGGLAGIYVANAGVGAGGVLNQHVTVHGTVTGGSDAAVHLADGGRLTVGRTGRVLAGSSGRAVLVNDPGRAEIVVHGLVRGGKGAPAAVHLTGGGTVTVGLTGRIHANGAEHAIRSDGTEATVVVAHTETRIAELTRAAALAEIRKRVDGTIGAGEEGRVLVRFAEIVDGVTSGHSRTVLLGADGAPAVESLPERLREPRKEDLPSPPMPPPAQRPVTPPPPPPFDCDRAMDDRCSLYEALPSALLAMNALPGYDDRLSAARDANGGWARVEGASREWKADSATQPGVAYDLREHGMRAGVELAAGDGLRVGVSAHLLRGAAKMSSIGEIELSGSGAGVNATFADSGFYADAQAAVTWFDAKLTSAIHKTLKSDANGVGYALGLEAGKRLDVSGALSVTPRAALAWSDAAMSAFVFTDRVGSGVRVSVEEAKTLTGRVGARVEAAPSGADGVLLFGALDVSHLLSQGAEAQVADTALKTTSEETGLHAGLGASRSWDDGRYALQGVARYAASGGDNSGFGGSLSFAMRF